MSYFVVKSRQDLPRPNEENVIVLQTGTAVLWIGTVQLLPEHKIELQEGAAILGIGSEVSILRGFAKPEELIFGDGSKNVQNLKIIEDV